jgi:hypothetical protein
MGALIGTCVFGLVLFLTGFLFLKLQKKGVAIFEFIAGGLFLVAGVLAIILSANQAKSEHYKFSQFKSDYKRAAKICEVPYTLENDVRQNIYFLTNTTILYITENKIHEITGFNVSISGNKTDGFFDDSNYALAVVCAVEDLKTPNEAADFINTVLDLPLDKYITGKSGFKYSHGLQAENTIGFNISKTFMTWDGVVKKANQ